MSEIFVNGKSYYPKETVKQLEKKLVEANEFRALAEKQRTETYTEIVKAQKKLARAVKALEKLNVGDLEYGQIYDVIDEVFRKLSEQ